VVFHLRELIKLMELSFHDFNIVLVSHLYNLLYLYLVPDHDPLGRLDLLQQSLLFQDLIQI
jgi:hypothetical protein